MHDSNVALEYLQKKADEDLQEFIVSYMSSTEEIQEVPRVGFRREMFAKGFNKKEIEEVKAQLQRLDAPIVQEAPTIADISIQEAPAVEPATTNPFQPSTLTGMTLISQTSDGAVEVVIVTPRPKKKYNI